MDAILDMNPDGNYDTVNTGYTSSEVQEATDLAGMAQLGMTELDEEIPPEVLAAGSADMPTEAELVAQQEAEEEAEERDRGARKDGACGSEAGVLMGGVREVSAAAHTRQYWSSILPVAV